MKRTKKITTVILAALITVSTVPVQTNCNALTFIQKKLTFIQENKFLLKTIGHCALAMGFLAACLTKNKDTVKSSKPFFYLRNSGLVILGIAAIPGIISCIKTFGKPDSHPICRALSIWDKCDKAIRTVGALLGLVSGPGAQN